MLSYLAAVEDPLQVFQTQADVLAASSAVAAGAAAATGEVLARRVMGRADRI